MPKRGLMPNETACESSRMPAVAPPGETAPDLFPVSRATRKILSPFGVPPMYSAYAQGESLCPGGGGLCPGRCLCPRKGLRILRVPRRAYAQEGAYAQRNGLRIVPDACGCSTWRDRVRFVSRFSRDTQNPQPFWRSPDVQRLGLCSTEKLMFHILCSTLMFQGGLCSTDLCSRLGLMFHRPGLCSTERPGESSQMPAGGATECIWDDSARRVGDSAFRYPH